jgi:isocitrate dehydrogenase
VPNGISKVVTLIPGDGIGPEVINAVRQILGAAEVVIEWEEAEAGAEVFRRGITSGVPRETVDSIARTRVALKGPLETPVGFGGKSANVTLRKLFEMFGNIRNARELPGVKTPFSGRGIDLVVVRENVEDLYAGIEHMQTPTVAQCLKLMSRMGCEKIVRLAFEIARAQNRTQVTCATKANIMKLTEGLLKRTFEEIAEEYPEIEPRHIIIDNLAHQLVIAPEQFDVLVMSNMNGDIISDLTSGLVGGLGLAPSANIGQDVAMFEAVHGSAPDIAGKGLANPTAMILSAVMMLRHLEEFDAANRVECAVLSTLERGETLTGDLRRGPGSASTQQFTDAVIANLGCDSASYESRTYRPLKIPRRDELTGSPAPATRRTVGMDVFVEAETGSEELGRSLERVAETLPVRLKMISNRGTVVYPATGGSTDCVDHWRCRFVLRDGVENVGAAEFADLLTRVGVQHHWNHVETLYEFDGAPSFTRAQGEN